MKWAYLPTFHHFLSSFSQDSLLLSFLWRRDHPYYLEMPVEAITMETVTDSISLGSKITADGDRSHKLNDACSLEEKL